MPSMTSDKKPAAYRETLARLAPMTHAQRADELAKAYAAVRAAEGRMAPATINRRYHVLFACEDALRGTVSASTTGPRTGR